MQRELREVMGPRRQCRERWWVVERGSGEVVGREAVQRTLVHLVSTIKIC